MGFEPRIRHRRAPNGRAGTWRAASRRLSPRPVRTASLRSRPPVRGRAPSRHLPGPTPSQRPPALRPSAEAALPLAPGLKWLRNKENVGSSERRSDWPGGGARRGNIRRRSPWQRQRDTENRGRGLTGQRTGTRTRAAAVSKPALQLLASGLRSPPAAVLTRSRPLRPARWPEPLARRRSRGGLCCAP